MEVGSRDQLLKIAWISSWPPRPCGIATYSAELVEALRAQGTQVEVICHPDGGRRNERHVHPLMDTERIGWDETVHALVERLKPDVVHVQHEFGLYRTQGDFASGLLRPVFRWHVESAPAVVVTYHSVYSELSPMIASYMDVLLRISDAGIVHERYQREALPLNLGWVPSTVHVIPHGTKTDVSVDREEAKRALGLTGKKTLGMLGWFTASKGFDRVLSLWDSLSEQLGPGVQLVLAGEARRSDPAQKEYRRKLLSLVKRSHWKSRITVRLGAFSPREYDLVLAAFDFMVMPYTFASQSGNLAHSFSLGVPVIASAIEGLRAEVEASGAGLLVSPQDDAELQRAITVLVKDDQLRATYAQRARTYVETTIGWPVVARKHLHLYRKVLAQPRSVREKIPGDEQL